MGSLRSAISYSASYLTSPTVRRASATYEKSLARGMVTTASMEYPPATQDEAPFSILMVGPEALFGLRSSLISSASWTIFGGRTFQRQKPESTYSRERPLDSA